MNGFRRTALRGSFALTILAVTVAVVSACGSQGSASTPKSAGPEATAAAVEASQAKERRIELAEEVVRNGKYELPDIGPFQLKDGNYQEKYGDGATQIKRVGVVTVAFGDLDGDKVEDAAVVLWANTGGTGTFIYLAPVLNKDGKGQQAGAQFLGDRVQIKSLAVTSGKIRVELLSQGSTDPMVSPSLQSVQEYALQGGKLASLTPAAPTAQPAPKPTQQAASATTTPAPKPTEQPAAKPSQNASSGVTGIIWIWDRFVDSAEKGSFLVPYPAAYRLELLADGNYSIQADCNRGSGSYAIQGSGLTLNPGPMTLAECQQGSRYKQYMEMVGRVGTYVLKGDNLYLNLKADSWDMVFSKLSSVTGKLVLPAGATVPEGATVEAMIVNAAGAQIGGWMGKPQPSMAFEAPFKPANTDPSAAYKLEVTIRDAQKKVIFKNSRAYSIVTQGNPTYHLEVQLEPVL